MNFDDAVRSEEWAGKRVYLFEAHHFAMLPWARLSVEAGERPRLLTLDFHTDTMKAFRKKAFRNIGGHTPAHELLAEERERLVRQIDRHDEGSVLRAVADLHHDEHIDAAIRSGILDVAFVIAFQDAGHIVSVEQSQNDANPPHTEISVDGIQHRFPLPPVRAEGPFTYQIPTDRIVILEKRLDYEWLPSRRDRKNRAYRNAAIESAFLRDRLLLIDRICITAGVPRLFERPFILDIDLDYFNTERAVQPADAAVFFDLVRRSQAMTVALESACVRNLRLPRERITSELLEERLRALVQAAMESS